MQVDTTAREDRAARRNSIGCSRRKVAGELDRAADSLRVLQSRDASLRGRATASDARRRSRPGSLASADTRALRAAAVAALALSRRASRRSTARARLLLGCSSRSRRCRRSCAAVATRERAAPRDDRTARGTVRALGAQRRRRSATRATVRRAYTSALGERLRLERRELHAAGALARALRRARRVRPTSRLDAERLLRELDEAAFGAGGAILERDAVERALRSVSRRGRRGAAASRAARCHARSCSLAALLAARASRLRALPADAAQRAFDARRARVRARTTSSPRASAFAARGSAEPRAPDAWANLGTAAWAAADTARAASRRGSARSASSRSPPDVRERVAARPGRMAVGIGRLRAAGVVAASIALAGDWRWCAAWLLATWLAVRADAHDGASALGAGRTRRHRRLLVARSAALDLDQRLAARDLDGASRATASLSSDPALGGERGHGDHRRGRARHSAARARGRACRSTSGRDGWIETSSSRSIAVASQIDGRRRRADSIRVR